MQEQPVLPLVEADLKGLNMKGCCFTALRGKYIFSDHVFAFAICSDGVISREEMRNYFIKANCQELTKGFSHNFQETTYFTPTFCDHCGGMVRNYFACSLIILFYFILACLNFPCVNRSTRKAFEVRRFSIIAALKETYQISLSLLLP